MTLPQIHLDEESISKPDLGMKKSAIDACIYNLGWLTANKFLSMPWFEPGFKSGIFLSIDYITLLKQIEVFSLFFDYLHIAPPLATHFSKLNINTNATFVNFSQKMRFEIIDSLCCNDYIKSLHDMSKNKGKLMIIDGNALIHRSFHALPPLTTKSGEVVNAVYGFITVLLKAIREFSPDYIALALDRKEKTFRHEEYKEYKATRVKAPQELYDQIPRVREVTEAFGIPVYDLAGCEADDLIGTIAKTVDDSIEKIIVTGDLDSLQLVNDHTKVFTMRRGLADSVIYDAKTVEERYGLKPEQMIDFKALRGDPSDNIPGVKGVGEKTAVELLQQFGTLDNIYEYIEKVKSQKAKVKNKEEIKDRILNLLIDYKDDAYMSKRLATIKLDAKIDFRLEDTKFGDFDEEKAAKLFSELEFKSLLPRLQELKKQADTKAFSKEEKQEIIANKYERNLTLFKYNLVDDDKDFAKFLAKLKPQKEFAFDTETTSFDPITAGLLGISFSWKEKEAYYLNFKSQKSKVKSKDLFNYQEEDKKNREDWLEILKPIFEDKKIKKYGHNIKFDIEVMASQGIKVEGVAADSMIASYVLNPGTRQHNLDALTFSEFNHQKITKDDLLGKGRDKIGFSEVPLVKIYNYSCEDADFTYRLVKKLSPALKKAKLDKLYNEIEVPLVPILAEMELNGVLINTKYLGELKKEVAKKISALEKKIYKAAGEEFNINSTQQLQEILYTKLGLSTAGITKTKTGISTGADELEKLKHEHPIIILIQEYRELTKLQSTYIDALPALVNSKTKRLHTSFNQSVTATGRLSSTEPNLQNIPVRTELGREIRSAFIADKGYSLLSLDYSQIELRLAAHMSNDPKMIKAFKDGADIHRATAAEINQVSPEAVDAELRRQAKAINFGILYGQGPHGLSQYADIPYMRAKEFIEQYFIVYKNIKTWIDGTIAFAHEHGFVETLFGRKRFLPEINSTVMAVQKAAERMATNTPLQGTAADMIKAAMIRVDEYIKKNYPNDEVRMLLQVHDELLFEVKDKYIGPAAKELAEIMAGVIELKVPVIVDAKAGDNWGNLESI